MTAISDAILGRFRKCRIIPVITLTDVRSAVPLAKALLAAGIDVLEITLRTSAALDSLRAIAEADLGSLVGAGTITRPQDIEAARKAGATFLVTPGVSPTLLPELKAFNGPIFPGAATVSEVMSLRDQGFLVQKLFPAEASGGTDFLKSVSGPLPDISFMPTGGIGPGNAAQYLKLPNVIAIGGSWIVPQPLIAEQRWDDITQLARTARSL